MLQVGGKPEAALEAVRTSFGEEAATVLKSVP